MCVVRVGESGGRRRAVYCDYWCDTCKRPLVSAEHASEHREFCGHIGVRSLFGQRVRVYSRYACACAYRVDDAGVFAAHVASCAAAFQRRVRLAGSGCMVGRDGVQEPVVVSVVGLCDGVVKKCCACAAMSMVERSRGDLTRRWYCRKCRCEVSSRGVSFYFVLVC